MSATVVVKASRSVLSAFVAVAAVIALSIIPSVAIAVVIASSEPSTIASYIGPILLVT